MIPRDEAAYPRHIQLAYGDEQNFLLPDSLVGEADARRAVDDAREATRFAADVRAATLGP